MTSALAWCRDRWGLLAATAAGVTAYAGMVGLDRADGTLRDGTVGRTIALYGLAFAGFLLAVWWNERRSIPWRWLWLAPLAFRGLLLLTSPTLSDDVYRYLWDGHLVTEGVNPYGATVDDPSLDPYEIDVRALVNNREYSTPYLPGTQLVFGATALVAPPEPLAMQLVMIGFDLAAALAIVRLLALAGLPRHRVLLYLWNPLVIVEVAHGAHLDAVMIALVLAALLATLRAPRPPDVLAPLALAVATMTRLVPALLLPVVWWRWSWRQRAGYGIAALLLVLPFAAGAGLGITGEADRTGVFGSIRVFVQEVAFNSGPYHWLAGWLERRGLDDPAATARFLTGAALVAFLAWVAHRVRSAQSDRQLLRIAALPFMGYLLLTSIVHPWYALIVMALLPFLAPAADEPTQRWWYLVPWLYLAAALPLSYFTYRDPAAFGELEWVRRLEWIPTLGLLACSTWFARRRPTTPSAMPAPTTHA